MPGGQFSLSAMIEYAGAPKAGAGAFMQSIPLVRNGQSDQYQGQVFVPGNETPGSYTIAVSASEISDVAISSDIRAITLAQLPQPVIDHPAVDSIRWDALLQSICSSSFPLIHWFSYWPELPVALNPSSELVGTIELQNMLYTSPVNLTGAVSQNGSLASLSIKLVNQQHGHFYLLFPPQTDGIFSIILTVRGTLKNVGDFETSATYTIHVVAKRAVFPLEISAWGEVLAALLVVLYLFRLCTTPLPFGAWSRSDRPGEHQFRLRWRRFWKLFFHRNRLLSKQAMMPTGLEFRFRRGRIWPRPSLWERRFRFALVATMVIAGLLETTSLCQSGLVSQTNLYTALVWVEIQLCSML